MKNNKTAIVYNEPNIYECIKTNNGQSIFRYFFNDNEYERHNAAIWFRKEQLDDLSPYYKYDISCIYHLDQDILKFTFAESYIDFEKKIDFDLLQKEYSSIIRYFIKRFLYYKDVIEYKYVYDYENLPLPANIIINGVGSPAYLYDKNYWLKIRFDEDCKNKYNSKSKANVNDYNAKIDTLDEDGIKLVIGAIKLRPADILISIE